MEDIPIAISKMVHVLYLLQSNSTFEVRIICAVRNET